MVGNIQVFLMNSLRGILLVLPSALFIFISSGYCLISSIVHTFSVASPLYVCVY